jgi:hypothetical protein
MRLLPTLLQGVPLNEESVNRKNAVDLTITKEHGDRVLASTLSLSVT